MKNQKIYIIQHVAKCGGTTVRKWLEKHYSLDDELLLLFNAPIYQGLSPFAGVDSITEKLLSEEVKKERI